MKKSLTTWIYLTCFILLSVLDFSFCLAQNESDAVGQNPTALKLFQSNDLIELSLSFDMKEVLNDVGEEREYHTGLVSYTDENGQQKSLPVKIRTRGHFRRDPNNCNFPPLRLDFPKSETENTIFEGQDEIKLVTHCRTKSKAFEQIVIKEYLVYRMYNLFTEKSYRVRLARITYEDTNEKKEPITQFGFFIEPTKQMAKRNGCENLEIIAVQQASTNKEMMMIICVFQYLIGNTDWSVPALHNIVLLSDNIQDPPVAVPFDFDWSGMVNAPYAYPAPQLGIDNVRQRLFRGICCPEEEYQPAFEMFKEKKSEIYSLCESFPYLSERELKVLINYFDQFYKTLDNPKRIESEFYLKCREQ
jgi:hypothetical protein